jgi:phospholipase/carboxylesterase
MAEDEEAAPLLVPLLRAFEMLTFVSRHIHPPDFPDLMASIGTPDADLKSVRATVLEEGGRASASHAALVAAADVALEAFAGLREAAQEPADMRAAYRALRLLPKGLETIYPLAGTLPLVDQFFLDPSLRSNQPLQRPAPGGPAQDNVGVMRFDGERGERGGFWLYVPEQYAPDRAWPLVVALHGGSGTGRLFLWSWLRDARSRGAILAAPTSVQATWALASPDADTPNLTRLLQFISSRWNVDPGRLLLTGMSDGGTFTYLSGLEEASPFTHLAPVSAAFHPMLAQMADAERTRGLPIYITHGALDWMFPVELARQAQRSLSAAGARVTYREVEDLSHCYPRELNGALLEWLETTPAKA